MQSSTSQAMRCRLLETRRMTLKIRTLTNELKRIQIVTTKTQYARRVPPLRSGTGSRGLIQEKTKREQKSTNVKKQNPWKSWTSRGRIRELITLRQLSLFRKELCYVNKKQLKINGRIPKKRRRGQAVGKNRALPQTPYPCGKLSIASTLWQKIKLARTNAGGMRSKDKTSGREPGKERNMHEQ